MNKYFYVLINILVGISIFLFSCKEHEEIREQKILKLNNVLSSSTEILAEIRNAAGEKINGAFEGDTVYLFVEVIPTMEEEPVEFYITVEFQGGLSELDFDRKALSGGRAIDLWGHPASKTTIPLGVIEDKTLEGLEEGVINLSWKVTTSIDSLEYENRNIELPISVNDQPTIEISMVATDSSIAEGDPVINVVTTLPQKLNEDLTLEFELGGTAEVEVDYTISSKEYVIPAGETEAKITIAPLKDGDIEEEEEITITVLSNAYGLSGDNKLTIALSDFDHLGLMVGDYSGKSTYDPFGPSPSESNAFGYVERDDSKKNAIWYVNENEFGNTYFGDSTNLVLEDVDYSKDGDYFTLKFNVEKTEKIGEDYKSTIQGMNCIEDFSPAVFDGVFYGKDNNFSFCNASLYNDDEANAIIYSFELKKQ